MEPFERRRQKVAPRTLFLVLASLLAGTSTASAGNIYKVTSQDGEKSVSYAVRFGGGKLMERFTAFDPESKKFVYLEWKRSDEAPVPAMKVWDHRTGETIPLYRFPGVKDPLPVIPSIESMKACPLTNDKNFKATLDIIID
jgi:hypothetical protein